MGKGNREGNLLNLFDAFGNAARRFQGVPMIKKLTKSRLILGDLQKLINEQTVLGVQECIP